tara:strand:- start:293 stop:694 length:402 start_codon:yes stop_codon:yes gene_type:complete
MKYLISYLSTGIFLLVIDYIWLGIVTKDYFSKQLAHLMADEVNMSIAAIFYVLYPIAVMVFVIFPALEKGSWSHAAIYGAFLGFIVYMTYDVTNAATLKDWPHQMSFIDVAWGTFVTSATALVGYYATSLFVK